MAPKSLINNVPRLGSHSGNIRNSNDNSDFKSSQKKAKMSNIESNLNREELNGLKSLKQRIDSGQIIIADTDKSKRFCALTPEQYVAAGEVHTKKDIEISAEKVKRIQNVN